LAEWIEAQPLDIIEWTIINGAVYTEMLSVLLRPRVLDDGTYVFAAPLGDGYIGFADLSTYGHYTRWIFDNPAKSIGKRISLPTYPTSLKGIAEAFARVTGKHVIAKDVTQDEWFAAASAYVNPDIKQPRIIAADEKDDTRFTFRHSFGAWWNVWSEFSNLFEGVSF